MDDLNKKMQEIEANALKEIKNAKDSKILEEIRIKYLGKKGELTSLLKLIGSLSKEERPLFGEKINKLREKIENELSTFLATIKNKELEKEFEKNKVDITLRGRVPKIGERHPLQIIFDEVEDIFLGLGFSIAEGPEIETDYYNFEALNMPKSHPARDSQDTLYINETLLLRTQTSPVQIRTMEKYAPNPVRIICPGRVFRRDTMDATHSPQFHQIEGLLVDKDVKFSDLIGVLEIFVKKMFGEDRKIRVRPGFFPFTEPSAEIDVSCIICGGKGCPACKNNGWLEILGSGAVHPDVLKAGGYDPEIYTGYAFGMGVERIAMLKFGIPDIRLFFENDIRFLQQFR